MDALFSSLLFKAGLAGTQKFEASKLERSKTRPRYEIADSQLAALEQMKMLASKTKMPGQETAEMLMDADFANATQQMIEASDSPNQVVENLASMNAKKNRSIQGMNIEGARMKRNAEMGLVDELNTMAKSEREQFYYNEVAPYEEAMASAKAKQNAAAHNFHDALRGGSELFKMNNPDGFEIFSPNPKKGLEAVRGAKPTADMGDDFDFGFDFDLSKTDPRGPSGGLKTRDTYGPEKDPLKDLFNPNFNLKF